MKISIIITYVDESAFLGKCIQSAVNQDYKNKEILLIANHATPACISIAQAFIEKYPELITLYREDKKGSAQARNTGITESKGDWLQFLDADDMLMPDKISRQVGLIQLNHHAIISGYKENTIRKKWIEYLPESKHEWIGLIEGRLGVTSSILWNKEAIVKLGGWNITQQTNQEYELLFQLLKNGRSLGLDTSVKTLKTERMNSLSNRSRLQYVIDAIELRNKISNFLNEQSQFDEIRQKAVGKYQARKLKELYTLEPQTAIDYKNHLKQSKINSLKMNILQSVFGYFWWVKFKEFLKILNPDQSLQTI